MMDLSVRGPQPFVSPPTLSRHWLPWAAFAIWAAPVAASLAAGTWRTEQGAQGPLILVTGAWLLWVRVTEAAALRRSGALSGVLAILLPCAGLYVFGQMINLLAASVLAVWGAAVALLLASQGGAVLRRLWFPLAYLLFLIPPPVMLVGPLVQSLQLWVAGASVTLAGWLGIEAAAQGSSLFVDQYELVVAAACAGTSSLFALLAMGIFYVHVRHGDRWDYALVLALAVVPVAIGTNLLRVLLLLVAVHWWGGEVLATPLHTGAGLAMAAVAMVMLVGVDVVLSPLAARWKGASARAR